MPCISPNLPSPFPHRRVNLSVTFKVLYTIVVNDDQQDATILAYLFIPNQLYMFWAMSSPIIRSTLPYLQLLILFTDTAGQLAAVLVDNIRSCKYIQVFLIMGEDIAQNT